MALPLYIHSINGDILPGNSQGCRLNIKSELTLYSNSMMEPAFTLGNVNFFMTRFLLILSLNTYFSLLVLFLRLCHSPDYRLLLSAFPVLLPNPSICIQWNFNIGNIIPVLIQDMSSSIMFKHKEKPALVISFKFGGTNISKTTAAALLSMA